MVVDDLNVFVDSISNYFQVTSEQSARVGTPFLTEDATPHISDYTGIISISGNYRGAVFFSAPERMLMRLLRELGLMSTQESQLLDLAGEISNTLSGNARRKFGKNFKIMPPSNHRGNTTKMPNSELKKIFIIPIEWSELTANLIISLESESEVVH